MNNTKSPRKAIILVAAGVMGLALAAAGPARIEAKQHKPDLVDPNDPTARLFQFLDTSYSGKLSDTYVLANFYPDPNNAGQELRHVLRVVYDKNRAFGRFEIYVRAVVKMTPQQLQTYSPKDIYDFGENDLEKFVKTSPGPFGGPGDIYLRAGADSPLSSQTITDDVRKTYDMYVSQYIMPDLEKKPMPPASPSAHSAPAPSSSGRMSF